MPTAEFMLYGSLRRLWLDNSTKYLLQHLAGLLTIRQVVQIGMGDGEHDDPMYDWLMLHKEVRALLVEPIPQLAAEVRTRHAARPATIVEEAAVLDINGKREMSYVPMEAFQDEPSLPYWVVGLGSMSHRHAFEHDPRFQRHIKVVEVQVKTFSNLMHEHGINKIDILVVDAEGSDACIVQQVLKWGPAPRVLVFENKHMSREKHEGIVRSLSNGYMVLHDPSNIDTVAILKPHMRMD